MNNFPFLSLMCLTNMVFLLWTMVAIYNFSLGVFVFSIPVAACNLCSWNVLFSTRYTFFGCGIRRKSKSNPITPNMLRSPHCLKISSCFLKQTGKALFSTSKPHGNRPSSTYKTMSPRSDPRFTSYHTLIIFPSWGIHSVLNTV